MNILGISCFYHDSAAALLRDGELVAAAHEERFTRKRHDAAIPKEAVRYCLPRRGSSIDDVDYVVFYDKPFIKFERILITYLPPSPAPCPPSPRRSRSG
jgi:carbamoyltransferase